MGALRDCKDGKEEKAEQNQTHFGSAQIDNRPDTFAQLINKKEKGE